MRRAVCEEGHGLRILRSGAPEFAQQRKRCPSMTEQTTGARLSERRAAPHRVLWFDSRRGRRLPWRLATCLERTAHALISLECLPMQRARSKRVGCIAERDGLRVRRSYGATVRVMRIGIRRAFGKERGHLRVVHLHTRQRRRGLE